MTLPVPAGPRDIDASWLSAALGEPVSHVDAERIGEETGFTGGALYRLRYGGGRSLVAKLAPQDPVLRRTLAAANAREVAAYARLGGGLPAPRSRYGAVDPATGASVLLLQDLRDHRARPFGQGWTAAEARAVVVALARCHAAWWDRGEVQALPGLALLEEFDFAAAWGRYPAALARLLPGMRLPDPVQALGAAMVRDPAAVLAPLLEAGPVTLLHRDCQADNVMFAADGTALLLDWQIMGKGRGAWDLCYALASSMRPDLRRRHEADLLRAYLGALRQAGVGGYGWRTCWQDYRRAAAGKLFLTVVATTLFDNAGPAKASWRRTDLERLLAFCADHAVGPALYGL